ncbi:choice-of-anchor D domain-containing protein [Stieleria sp. JC731]|uniref:choice-of-anchor D domain-containing protein n=1 Tax=Pirellulaceae TaxID=2691357 RepID=UPI001E4E7ED5|nr:choice-of-anchor D domain-containing protein [Stieleria sp. JC731]MCC9600837.1 choice-of-anchor D domain-containing protein [Stieleria sp. JC731]
MSHTRNRCRLSRSKSRRSIVESLESRRLLAASLGPASDGADFETDPRIISMFYGPLQPGRAVPPIQAIAPLIEEPETQPDGLPADEGEAGSPSGVAPFDLDQTFLLHSRPDSNFTIYLDFDGHVTVGTSWNSGYGIDEIVHPNYWGGTGSNFSNSQLELIQEIWQVVAEDFAPFDVNITTEEPTDLDDLRYNGSSDTRWGSRVVMTKQSFADCGCGGHAYLGAFDDPQDEPAIVYNSGLNAGSETVSHEVGHQLGLHHDGNGSNTYYRGHGSGDTGWGPIMGAPFSKLTTQWSQGEYYDADRTTEDDLAVITGSSNFPYVDDDYSDSQTGATAVLERNTTSIEAFGIIETSDDVDWLKFNTGGGDVSLSVDVTGYKPNLDVWAGLFDSDGNFIVDANPQTQLSASFGTINLDAGEYFIKIEGGPRDSTYDPVLDQLVEPSPPPYTVSGPLGYSDYGSLGQYRVQGTIVDPGTPTLAISAGSSAYREGQSATITLTTSDASDGTFVVEIVPTRQSHPSNPAPDSSESDDFGIATTQTVNVVGGTGTLTIPILDDSLVERTETFRVLITDSAGMVVSNRFVDINILESKTEFSIVAIDSVTPEGDFDSENSHRFEIRRTGRIDTPQIVTWQRQLTGSNPAQASDFTTPDSGTFEFAIDQTSATLQVDLSGDIVIEADEDYAIELAVTNGESYLISPIQASAEGTIIDDESVISFTSSAQFRVRQLSFSGANFDHFAIDNFAISGTAINDDFDPDIDNVNWDSILSATAESTFPNSSGNALLFGGGNERSATTVPTSPPLGSQIQFDIIFSDGSQPGLNATENGEDAVVEYSLNGLDWIEIQRRDESEFTVWTPVTVDVPAEASFEPTMFVEGNTGTTTASMVITRLGYLDKAIDVGWAITPTGGNPVDAADFGGTLPAGTVNFAAGEATATVDFDITGDFSIEPDETFNLTVVSNSGGPISNASLPGSITNDDVAGPEINILGSNGETIFSGDSTPSLEDGTQFALLDVDSDPIIQTMAIENTGLTDLHVGSILIEGADANSFEISQLPPSTIAPGSSAAFSIAFNPTTGGQKDATIVINNDDPSESQYNFAVRGLATDLKVEEVLINDGSDARSQIESITVRFNQLVSHELVNRAFQVRLVSDQQSYQFPSVASTDVNGKTEARLTFPTAGQQPTSGSTWTDGFYELRIIASSVVSVTQVPYPMATDRYFGTADGEVNPADRFFRLFGDINGDGEINTIDSRQFRESLLTVESDENFNSQFDFDTDGDVDRLDYSVFRQQLFRSL